MTFVKPTSKCTINRREIIKKILYTYIIHSHVCYESGIHVTCGMYAHCKSILTMLLKAALAHDLIKFCFTTRMSLKGTHRYLTAARVTRKSRLKINENKETIKDRRNIRLRGAFIFLNCHSFTYYRVPMITRANSMRRVLFCVSREMQGSHLNPLCKKNKMNNKNQRNSDSDNFPIGDQAVNYFGTNTSIVNRITVEYTQNDQMKFYGSCLHYIANIYKKTDMKYLTFIQNTQIYIYKRIHRNNNKICFEIISPVMSHIMFILNLWQRL